MRGFYSSSVNTRGYRNARDAHARRGDDGRPALRAHLRVAEEELSPRRGLAPVRERAAVEEGPAVVVVVEVAGENEAVDERRMKEQVLEALQRPEPDQI